MQASPPNDPAENTPQEPDPHEALRAELARLKEKRGQTDDADIASVLDMRIKEIQLTLPAAVDSEAEEEEEEADEPEDIKKLRAELEKLKDKRFKTKDRNIIKVLDMRIAQIEPTLPPPRKPKVSPKAQKAKEEEEAFAKIPLPTPAESEQAEKLIRQSMLEKRRGNVNGATDLLKKAVEVAPGSAVVLEALADDLVERKMLKQAREAYKRAVQLDPKNVGLERKYAESVLRGFSTMSVDNQLRYGVSDSLFLTGQDNVAGLLAAKFLSALVPGVGQMVIGRTTKGICLLVANILCYGLIVLWHSDFEGLTRSFSGLFGRAHADSSGWSMRVIIPVIGLLIIWFISMADLFSGQSRQVARNRKIERPKPPEDLPFE